MKLLLIIYITISFSYTFAANSNKEQYYSENREKLKEELELIKGLAQIKVYILNGNIKKAKFFLNRINKKNEAIQAVKARYLVLINFIEGNYKESLDIINNGRLKYKNLSKKSCMIEILNRISLGKISDLNKYAASCISLTEDYSKNEQFWLISILDLVKNHQDEKIFRSILTNNSYIFISTDLIKIWLKLAIYTNKEKIIAPYLSLLPDYAYRSRKVRELIGFLHYRIGNKKLAMEFIDGISTANTENIRGNMKLEENEMELAFGHFKLALNKKKDSKNALERALPISWILEQWDETQKMLDKLEVNKSLEKEFLSLQTAIDIQKNNLKKAHKNIKILEIMFNRKLPLNIILMDTYVSMVLNDKMRVRESIIKACKKLDGLNCWQSMQLQIWKNLGKVIQKNDLIHTKERSVKTLKNLTTAGKGISEQIYINQKDIEELDSSSIESSKNQTSP